MKKILLILLFSLFAISLVFAAQGSNLGKQGVSDSENDKVVTLKINDKEVHSDLNLTQEKEQNMTKLKVRLSNGMNSEIKVMPETASETALARLQAKCENCTIQLKEVGSGNQTRAVYEIKTQKKSRFLGLFAAKMQVQAQVDAENGEVVKLKKPWWAFLAAE